MITFKLAKPPMVNASVTFHPGVMGKDGKEDKHDAYAKRDAEGNIEVTVDAMEPDPETPILFVNIDEKKSEYRGRIVYEDKKHVFKA